jgi:hypothetical protein
VVASGGSSASVSHRRDDPHDYRVGRLKHERVTVPRGPDLLKWAMQVRHMIFIVTECIYNFLLVIIIPCQTAEFYVIIVSSVGTVSPMQSDKSEIIFLTNFS